MTYASTITFDPKTGLLSGKLSTGKTAPVPPLGDVVVSGYVEGANMHSPFAQCRSASDGTWTLSTVALATGPHLVGISFDYGKIVATAEITTAGPGAPSGGARAGLQVNNGARA